MKHLKALGSAGNEIEFKFGVQRVKYYTEYNTMDIFMSISFKQRSNSLLI